jgi:hypothetical protein
MNTDARQPLVNHRDQLADLFLGIAEDMDRSLTPEDALDAADRALSSPAMLRAVVARLEVLALQSDFNLASPDEPRKDTP